MRKNTTCSKQRLKNLLFARFPVVSWLFLNYDLKTALSGDIISGVTVAVMHIPQGMAYAMLANVDPICGIYLGFFPVLIYAMLGTSRHCAMGSFSVVCIMTGKVVSELSILPGERPLPFATDKMDNITAGYTPTEVACMVALAVGMWEVIMGVFQLGTLTVFLSHVLVSGFTTGAAVHVLTSQVHHIFAVNVSQYNGPLRIIHTYVDIGRKIPTSNLSSVIMSVVCIAVLTITNEIFKPRLRKYTAIPIPIELLTIVFGTVASYFLHLNENYGLKIVGHIPTGLPAPALPRVELFPKVLVDGLIIAVVAYTIAVSIGKTFAKRMNYKIDATQELYAMGLATMFGSFFSCPPVGTCLSRSALQHAVGGVTQLVSFISCFLLLFVLLFIGPLFEYLPNCVLASIIIVALKGMLFQVADLKALWNTCRTEALHWMLTFLTVVVIDIDYGLLIGIAAFLVILLARNHKAKIAQLGNVPGTDMYLETMKYRATAQIPGFFLIQISGCLHFANQDSFRRDLTKLTGLDPDDMTKEKRKTNDENGEVEAVRSSNVKTSRLPKACYSQEVAEDGDVISKSINGLHKKERFNDSDKSTKTTKADSSLLNNKYAITSPGGRVQCIVLDLYGVGYVDASAGKHLLHLQKDYSEAGILLVIGGMPDRVQESLSSYGLLKDFPPNSIFHSVHDAIWTVRGVLASETKKSHVFEEPRGSEQNHKL